MLVNLFLSVRVYPNQYCSHNNNNSQTQLLNPKTKTLHLSTVHT